MVRRTASGDVEAGAALLAEPADHEQSVVDAEPDAEHDHDVQRVERHVGERRDDAERDHRRRTRPANAIASGMPAATMPPNTIAMTIERDRQRDQLGALRVLLGSFGELAGRSSSSPPTSTFGASMPRSDRFDGVDRVSSCSSSLRFGASSTPTPIASPSALGPRLHRRDAGDRLERRDRRVRHGRALDDRGDRLARRGELVEALPDLLRLERLRARRGRRRATRTAPRRGEAERP